MSSYDPDTQHLLYARVNGPVVHPSKGSSAKPEPKLNYAGIRTRDAGLDDADGYALYARVDGPVHDFKLHRRSKSFLQPIQGIRERNAGSYTDTHDLPFLLDRDAFGNTVNGGSPGVSKRNGLSTKAGGVLASNRTPMLPGSNLVPGNGIGKLPSLSGRKVSQRSSGGLRARASGLASTGQKGPSAGNISAGTNGVAVTRPGGQASRVGMSSFNGAANMMPSKRSEIFSAYTRDTGDGVSSLLRRGVDVGVDAGAGALHARVNGPVISYLDKGRKVTRPKRALGDGGDGEVEELLERAVVVKQSAGTAVQGGSNSAWAKGGVCYRGGC